MKYFILTLTAIALFAAVAAGQNVPIPEFQSPVTDLTGSLQPGDIAELVQTINDFEKSTSNQIVVFMIKTLEGEEIQDFCLRVAEKNKVGQKGRNNGILLLVVKDDRKLRIEVGYGLEGALPDALNDQIIRNEIAPSFKQGDYAGGLRAGVDAIMKATKGEYIGTEKRNHKGSDGGTAYALGILGFIIFLVIRMASGFSRYGISSSGHRSSGMWWGGGGFGGGGFGGGGGGGWSGGGGSFGGGGASGSW